MEVLHLTSQNFEKEVKDSEKKVLVDFWAPWCGPCKMVAPVVEEIAKELEGKVVVGKVNVDEEPTLAAEYGVMSIPTFIVFEKGEPKKSGVGFMPKEELKKLLD